MDQIKINYQIEATAKELAVEFLKWCTEPVSRKSFKLKLPRVVPFNQDYQNFVVIDEDHLSILGKGVFLTHEQLFDYWFENIRTI